MAASEIAPLEVRSDSDKQTTTSVGEATVASPASSISTAELDKQGGRAIAQVMADENKADAPGALPTSHAEILARLQTLSADFDDATLLLMLELIDIATVQGIASPAVAKKAWEITRADSGSIAESWVPLAGGVMELKRAVEGVDRHGKPLTAGKRVLEGVKGIFAILLDLHTLGIGGAALRSATVANRVVEGANDVETMARITPALKEVLSAPGDMTAVVKLFGALQQKTLVQKLKDGFGALVVQSFDPSNATAVAKNDTGGSAPTEAPSAPVKSDAGT